MRIVSYNIASAIGCDDKKYNWRRSADMIKSLQPDVVALQEVTINRPGCDDVDYAAAAGEYLGMYHAFGDTLTFDNGGKYGLAVLSRYPLEVVQKLYLPVPEPHEKRIVLVLKIDAPEPFYFAVSHFSYSGEMDDDDQVRMAAARTIAELFRQNNYAPAILCGDFNTVPDSEPVRFLRGNGFRIFNDLDTGVTPTVNCRCNGWVQIDYITGYPAGAFTAQSFNVVSEHFISDHAPVYADMNFAQA